MESKKLRTELVVSALENGTVIDHIPSKNVFQVIKILNLDTFDNQILFGTNLDSKRYGKKGIIKVKNKFFEIEEINKIAIVAPSATLIVIKNFEIIEKKPVEVPGIVDKFIKCINPNCVTNHENIHTRFTVIDKDAMKLQCHYCEKTTSKENFIFI
ncbi:MAG: aspartate carbamoyltransferase regulatory subunit [Bacteroidetes bacterium]|nr:aspartate carbamoyltransferase regulatory subunit [Bacteroidota bacterium]